VPPWQILSAREQIYQFCFFDKRKKETEKREKFEIPSVLD
jgi:hypothetical protein